MKGVHNSITDLDLSYKNLEQQTEKSKRELEKNTAILERELGKGREIQGSVANI